MERLNFDEIVNVIVKEVLKRIDCELYIEKRNILVIYEEGIIDFKESLKSIKTLIKNGWKVKVLISQNAIITLDHGLIKDELKIEDIFVEGKVEDLECLKKDINRIMIPNLTINSAAKISLGISDTLPTQIISWGIIENIPIIAAEDNCNLKNNYMPLSYENMVLEHLSKIQDYGIILTNSQNLYKEVTNYNKGHRGIENKKLITEQDVIYAKKNSNQITVLKDTIITELAKDTALNMGVNIKRID